MKGKSYLKTIDRFSGITWGNDNMAIADDYWWNNRNTRTYVFNPSDASKEPEVIFDRNYQDRYSDPGSFVTTKNEFGQNNSNWKIKTHFYWATDFLKKDSFLL